MTHPIDLVPAHKIRSRNLIRVHNEGVGVLSATTMNGVTRIRYAARLGNDVIEVAADSLIPRYAHEGD